MIPIPSPNPPSRTGLVESGGRDLEYIVEGRGPDALVIGSARFHARTFSPALRRRLRLAFGDHLGFAPTYPAPPAATLDRLTADIEALRSDLVLDRPILIGHSVHGFMAIEYARRHPDRVSRVVLISTPPAQTATMCALSNARWAALAPAARKARYARDTASLAEAIAAEPHRRLMLVNRKMAARAFRDFTYDPGDLWLDVVADQDAQDQLWGSVFLDYDAVAALAELRCPVLIVMGQLDYLMPPAEAWLPRVGDMPHVELRILERSGHYPQLEDAAAFDGLLLGWLADQGRGETCGRSQVEPAAPSRSTRASR